MVWRIDATDEWTHDAALAEYAEEYGYGAVEYDEDSLIKLVESLEEHIREKEDVFRKLYAEIEGKCIDGQNSGVGGKNAYFSLIMHSLKLFEAEMNKR